MVALISFKEALISFYQKREDLLRPLFKVLLSFLVLCLLQNMFGNIGTSFLVGFLVVSLAQAFLPISMLFFSGSVVIGYNLWLISPDICLGFVLIFLIALLTYIRMDSRTACITILIPVLFFLKLEYLIPVTIGFTIGFSGIFPAVVGTLIYYMMLYTGDASNLLTYSADTDMGTGLSRVINLMVIDRRMMILLVTFAMVIFITSLLYHMFYELAWMYSATFGNAAMIFLMLCGRYIFELDYTIWRLFVEAVVSVILCTIIQFFRGIGDVSRMERTSFEDDDYIYYVKAVPKIRVAQKNRSVTNISSEVVEKITDPDHFEGDSDLSAGEDEFLEDGALRRKRRAERKRIFGRKDSTGDNGKKASGQKDPKTSDSASPQAEGTIFDDSEPWPDMDKDVFPNETPLQTPEAGQVQEEVQDGFSDQEQPSMEENKRIEGPSEKEERSETKSETKFEMKSETGLEMGSETEFETEFEMESVMDSETGSESESGPQASAEYPDGRDHQDEAESSGEKGLEEEGKSEEKKGKVIKLDMEDILKENMAAARELSAGKSDQTDK